MEYFRHYVHLSEDLVLGRGVAPQPRRQGEREARSREPATLVDAVLHAPADPGSIPGVSIGKVACFAFALSRHGGSGAASLDPAQYSRELLYVPLAEPLEEVRADGREVGWRSFEQAVAAGLRRRDPGGASVGGVALPRNEALVLELHREP